MTIPCEDCITLSICRQKEIVTCSLIDDYSFLHDYDPGHLGATNRARYVGQYLFKNKRHIKVILNRQLQTVQIKMEDFPF